VMLPFRLGRHWLVDVWNAVEACKTQFGRL
jgi:hypothetical protein